MRSDQLTKAEVGKVFDQNVDGVLRPDGAGLQKGEAGLHEDDHGAHDHEEEVVDVLRDGCERVILAGGGGVAAPVRIIGGVAGIDALDLHLDRCTVRGRV